jgi:hypothetical protein
VDALETIGAAFYRRAADLNVVRNFVIVRALGVVTNCIFRVALRRLVLVSLDGSGRHDEASSPIACKRKFTHEGRR